jgi:hypothetical protein
MKPTDERKARGWMKMHCNSFDDVSQLSDACCDWLNAYEDGCKVPVRLIEIATEVMEAHK